MKTRLGIVIGGVAALAAAPVTLAGGGYAGTSFEEPAAVGGQYVDTLDPATDHALLDNAGEPFVNYTSTGGELGFSSFYTNTRDGVGLSDGDFVGVTSFTGDVGAFTDGAQGFQLSDIDGLMTTSLDSVVLMANSMVSIDIFITATGWEADDRIRVWVEVDGGTEIDLLNTMGSDIDDLDIEGQWLTLETDLSAYTMATLRFELDSNAGTEALYVDNAFFNVIPAPGAIALLGLAGLMTRSRRRR